MAIGRTKEFLDDQYKKQRPRYFSLIINGLFMLTFIGFTIYLTILKHLKIWVCIVIVLLMIFFGAVTIYTKLLNRRKNRHIINSFKEETEIIIEEIKRQKKLVIFEIENQRDVVFNFEETDTIIDDVIVFDEEKRRFEGSNEMGMLLQIGITCSGLVVDNRHRRITGIKGVTPCSVWIKKKLTMPSAKKGKVFVDFTTLKELNNSVVVKFYRNAETYYDPRNGLLVMGERKMNPLYDLVQVSTSIVLALYEGELISVFIQIQKNVNI